MHSFRDEMVSASAGGQAACAVESFGKVSQPLGDHTLGLVEDFPEAWAPRFKPELDVTIFPHLMCMGARATMRTFTSKLGEICPSDDTRFKLMVGPIKKPARIAVKVNEYKIENEGDLTKWPFICKARRGLAPPVSG